MTSAASAGVGRNAVLNGIGFVVPTAAALLTVPLYLNEIGETRYGVLAIIWVLLGYFAAFDLGLGRAATNEVAKLRHASGAARGEVVWTAVAVNAALGVVGGAALLGIGEVVMHDVLDISTPLANEASTALLWVALAVPFVTLSSVLVGALEGLERFGIVNGIEIPVALIFQLLPLAVAYVHGPDLEWLVAAAAIGPVSKTILALFACVRYVPLRRPQIARARARPLFHYGGWITVTAVLAPILTSVDRLVLGAVAGAQAVTRYVVPMNVVSRLSVVPYSLSRSLFPRLSFLEVGDANALGRNSVLALNAVLTPVIVLGTIAMEPFLRMWVGATLAEPSAPVGVILLAGVWCNALALVPFSLIQGQGRPDLTAKIHLAEVVPYLALLWIGVTLGGIRGVALAWTARMAADSAVLLAASSIGLRELARLVPAFAVIMTSIVVALVAFDDLTLRLLIGSALGLAAFAASAASLPGVRFPLLSGRRLVFGRSAAAASSADNA